MPQIIDKAPIIAAAAGAMKSSLAAQKQGTMTEDQAMEAAAGMMIGIIFSVLNEVKRRFYSTRKQFGI